MKLTVKLTFTSKHFIKNTQYTSVLNFVPFLLQWAISRFAYFFGDELFYNFYSLHIHQRNILPASRLLLASHLHTCISNMQVTCMLLTNHS